jgi:hypothetical protein
MISILLCIAAFAVSFYAGRRSLVKGLGVALAIGYFYGILRANLPESASHFIFDAAVVGLYVAQRGLFLNPAPQLRIRTLQKWLIILSLWPALLLLVPVQDSLVELVGLRGHIFLLPFLLFGARLSEDDLYRLALYVSCLNLVAFGFAVAEYFIGVERFFPHREGVTSIIYYSRDVADNADFRIPAIFNTAHAYAGTMVMTLPLLFGAWVQKHGRNSRSYLLSAALLASIIGVFMAAARTPVILLCFLLLIVMFSGKIKILPRLAWLLMLGGVVWLVSNEARLQRFTTLQDTSMVTDRVLGSINEGFFKLAAQYPLGNGLGGGGTSLPYFLQDRVKERPLMENEYARIALEQGIPGLCLWIGFLFWAVFKRINPYSSRWALGRRLAWCICVISFGTGFIGTGLLTAIPHTAIMLLMLGVVIKAPERSENEDARDVAVNASFPIERAVLATHHA